MPPQPPYWPPVGQPPYGPGQPPKRHGGLIAAMVAGLLVMLLIAGVTAFEAGRLSRPSATARTNTPASTGQPNGTQPSTTAPSTSADVAAIAAKVSPAVVDVNTVLGYQNARAAGTGVVLTSNGLILTNNHVVSGATTISVTDVGNGKTYSASVVGYDVSEDIAVLKLANASGLATATIGDSSTVQAGDPVVAIGNAGGKGGTPAAVGGTVTALDMSITAQDEIAGTSEQLSGLIEVAAAIQSGDSGGPLVNSSGQVIGIDTAASTGYQYQASSGDGYAITINTAMTIEKQIEAGKASDTVHIGATAFLGIESESTNGANGAQVAKVLSGSPAEAAGLQAGDVITSVGGHTVTSATALSTVLNTYHPGNKVRVRWTDASGTAHSANVTLASGPVG
jgi:S1-C subfamily serine protease